MINKSVFLLLTTLLFSSVSFSQDMQLSRYHAIKNFFSASLYISEHAGQKRHSFTINYHQNSQSRISLCSASTDFYILFVVGPADKRESIKVPTTEYCASMGSYMGTPNTASWSITLEQDPVLWEKLFPADKDGNRWYAVEVAGVEERTQDGFQLWDSQFGQNYQLVLVP